MKLNDNDIRQILKSRLTKYKNCKVYEEVTLPNWKARADLVAVNGHVTGYEIKSDFDTLNRLSNQITQYNNFFEMNYIVVSNKFAFEIECNIPEYWGIIVVNESKKLIFKRKAKLNPNFEFRNMLYLIPSNDLKRIARESSLGYDKYKINNLFKQDVIDLISGFGKVTKTKIKRHARELLKINI